MIAAESTLTGVTEAKWARALVWFTLAVSCIVFIEPAPYDYLAILLFILLFSLKLRLPSEIEVAGFLLALFVAGNLIGALTSGEPEVTFRPLVARTYMVLSWLLFTALIAANTESMVRLIWNGYTVAALFASVWGCLEYYGLLPDFFGGDTFGRAKGPFKDANVFGPFLVPVALHALASMLRSRGPGQIAEAAKFLVIAFGLLLSFSRGAWLNFSIALGLYLLFSISTAPTMKAKIRLVILVVFLAFAAGLTLTWAINNTAAGQQFFDRAKLFKQYDLETGGRFYTQAQALQAIATNPVGVGPGMSTPELGMEPHNLYLHVAVEGGWIGAVSFYLFLLLSIVRGMAGIDFRWTMQSELHVALAALLGTLSQSLFIDSTHWRHLWLLFAMLWGLTIAIERNRASRKTARVMFNPGR